MPVVFLSEYGDTVTVLIEDQVSISDNNPLGLRWQEKKEIESYPGPSPAPNCSDAAPVDNTYE